MPKNSSKTSKTKKTKKSPRGAKDQPTPKALEVTSTGILGLDQILGGGLPRGRAMLVVGGAGSGKTLLGTEFLYRGGDRFDEPGVLLSFEESVDEIVDNAAGFGWGLERLIAGKKLAAGTIDLAAANSVETGDFDLSGLFVRLETAIASVNAKRIVLDGLNNLLASFQNERIVRTELLRIFKWLKDQGLTVLATGEQGDGRWTRMGFEEYLADGLIVLENRVKNGFAQRVLQVVKCRGIDHATGEYPFLIGRDGFSLFPIDAARLDYRASPERVSSGIQGLDEMLDGKGFYRGSMVLVAGSAGTGKTSLGAAFVDAACKRGESAIIFAFEESPAQIVRNMRSIGIDLEKWRKKGLLTIHASRAMHLGLEGHLTQMQEVVRIADPQVAVVDPLSSLASVGNEVEVKSLMTRLVDYLRAQGVTTMANVLATGGRSGENGELAVSSAADTWIVVRTIEDDAERNNVIHVIKSRGMKHSNQLREFNFTPKGIEIVDPYIGIDGVAIGSKRLAEEAKDRLAEIERQAEIEKKRRGLEEQRRALDSKIQTLEAEYEAEVKRLEAEIAAHEKVGEVTEEFVVEIAEEREIAANS